MSTQFIMLLLAGSLLLGLACWIAVKSRSHRLVERLLEDTNRKLENLQLQFGRFAPSDVVEYLMESGSDFPPSRRTVTVLFSDLKEFTRMCDQMDPDEIVPLLNEYFQRMTRVITQHHGRVTELTGDGILALFGALENNPWMSRDAVLAALDMKKELAEYNRVLQQRAQPELIFGIGIHQGEVVAGVMGNADMSRFGVVGDTINLAARVEALTRIHDVDILITEEVKQVLDDSFRIHPMEPSLVKGKPEPIATFWVEERKK